MVGDVNYVFFGDSPTLDTGFACVTRNIVTRLPFRDKIHFWGLGYGNIPHNYNCKLYPGNPGSSWQSEANLKKFYEFLSYFKTPIVMWVLHDSCRLKVLAPIIDKIRETNSLKIIAYIPVDSYTTPEDRDFLSRVDVPVAYTQFGAYEIQKHTKKPIYVTPHGVEHEVYNTSYNRYQCRCDLFSQITDDDFLITNVNSNSYRKDPFTSLYVLAELLKLDPKYKLYLHMNPNPNIGLNIKAKAADLNLLRNVIFADPLFGDNFSKYNCSKELLAKIYSASDLVITTSHGEGWGLTTTEAAACGTPVAVPKHTSFEEIFSDETCTFLPTKNSVLYENKYWPYVDAELAAHVIYNTTTTDLVNKSAKAQQNVLNYNWDYIALWWSKILTDGYSNIQ
jgi:glycosyltransferase involved in cell wall biosynthesis